MPTNDFLPFADGAGANVLSQADYVALSTLRAGGFISGTAKSTELNKVWRQSSMMAHVLAQFISDANAVDVLDNGNATTLLAALNSVVRGTVTTISASASLAASQSGLVLLNVASGNSTVTLPVSNANLGVSEFIIRRTDATANTAAIAASGSDKIMLDTIAAGAGLASTELLFSGDYLRLRSDGAGKWWCVGQAQLPKSIDSGLVVFTAAGVSTFQVPPVLRSGRRTPVVTVIGGGGGGGRSDASAGSGGGGGGGVGKRRCDLTGQSSVSVTVGAKGTGAIANGTAGVPGGASSFGSFVSASGGLGGGGASTTINLGGTTGVGSGGDITSGLGSGTANFGGEGGNGGGPGPRAEQSSVSGVSAAASGGGGSGARAGNNGGNGKEGEVSIQW